MITSNTAILPTLPGDGESHPKWDQTVIARAFLEKCGFDYNHRPGKE